MPEYIKQYHKAIQNGTIKVGRWIKLWYEYIILGLAEGKFFFDPLKANRAINYVERYCRHHEGSLGGQLIKLELWQKAFLSVIFGIVDSNGLRQFREVILIVARKNGKTLFAAAIASYCAFADKEYGGKVYMTAPKLDQANLCFDAFHQMLLKEKKFNKKFKKRRSDIYIANSNTTVKPIAFSVKKSDGFNISLGICDEIACWEGDAGLKFYEVLKSSMGARSQPILMSCSTAGYISNSIYDELIKRATALLLGNSKEARLAPFLYMIDDVDKWNDIEELKKSNPNLGVSVTEEYLLEEIAIAEGSYSKKCEFLTKYCNIKQSSAIAWLPYNVIDAVSQETYLFEQFYRCYAVVGIDLSQTTDLTSACFVIEKGGKLHVIAHFWLPGEKIDELSERDGIPYRTMIKNGWLSESGENFVQYQDCFNWIKKAVRTYKILPLMTGYDRWSSQYLIQDMKAAGFHCDDVYQGENLTPVIRECEGLIRDGKLLLGDNQLLKAHFLSTALNQNAETQKVRIAKIEQRQHIDGCAAVLCALTVRQKHYLEIGKQLQNLKR
ncbi:MAG: terminase large subunit [Acutalibacteraceae bacterium]